MDSTTTRIEAFSVTAGFIEGCRVLVLEGDLDAAEAERMGAALDACGDGMPVVVDLRLLGFIDSAGIHTLLRGRRVGRPAALICVPGSNVSRVLDIVDVQETIPIYDNVAAALEHLQAA